MTGKPFAGVGRRRRRIRARVAARLAAPVRFCRRGVFISRSVPRVGRRRRDQLSPPRHRDAGDVGPRPSTGTGTAAAEDSDCVHHRTGRQDPPSTTARPGGRRVPVQAVQRGSPAGCGQGRASSAIFSAREGDMSSPGEARSESMARVISRDTPVVFVVDDDVSVRESLELLILSGGWQPETFASAEDFLARFARGCSELPGSRCGASQPQWPRSPETHRRSPRHADHLHHRLWRRADHGAGDEGWCSGVPDQAIRR